MIPLSDCKPGYLYKLRSRNLLYGVFDGTDGFVGIREKFDNRFLDKEIHYSASAHYGTATPVEEIGPCPVQDLRTSLDTECGKCKAKMKYVGWTADTRPEGNTFPGRWMHLDKKDCGRLDPVGPTNKPLFDWLDEKEKQLLNEARGE